VQCNSREIEAKWGRNNCSTISHCTHKTKEQKKENKKLTRESQVSQESNSIKKIERNARFQSILRANNKGDSSSKIKEERETKPTTNDKNAR